MAEKRQEGRVQVPDRQTRGSWRRESAGDLPAKKIGIQTGKKERPFDKGVGTVEKTADLCGCRDFSGSGVSVFCRA